MKMTPQRLLNSLEPYWYARRWLIAYSGGVDSHVLLHLLSQLSQLTDLPVESLPTIEAIHINHQLQPEASQWAKHCEQQATDLGIPISVYCVEVDCQAQESLEDKARQARYQCLQTVTKTGDLVLMGHHLDDQVETVFLRLLRGSGSRGMAAMPHSRKLGGAQLFRPLLDMTRSDIEHYAVQHTLTWIEDPSNQSQNFDRNFLRLQILPQLEKRWPRYRQTLARTAKLSDEAYILNTELAELDFHSLGLSVTEDSLPLPLLDQLSVARKKNLFRYWFLSRNLTLPTAAQLQAVLDNVISAKRDAEPLVQWPMTVQALNGATTVEVRRFRDQLYAMTNLAKLDNSINYHWNPSQVLSITGAGQLSTISKMGEGLRVDSRFDVQFRQGTERCKPYGRANSQTLKKLFQEYNVPPWLRDRVPLIYSGKDLVAVGDLWVCDGFTANSDEYGLVIAWHKPC